MFMIRKICLLYLLSVGLALISSDAAFADSAEERAAANARKSVNYSLQEAQKQMDYLQEDYDKALEFCQNSPNDLDCIDENGYFRSTINDYNSYKEEHEQIQKEYDQRIQTATEKNIKTEKKRDELTAMIEQAKKDGVEISPEVEKFIQSSNSLDQLEKRTQSLTKDIEYQKSPEGKAAKQQLKEFEHRVNQLTAAMMDQGKDYMMASNDAAFELSICYRGNKKVNQSCVDETLKRYGIDPDEKTTSQQEETNSSKDEQQSKTNEEQEAEKTKEDEASPQEESNQTSPQEESNQTSPQEESNQTSPQEENRDEQTAFNSAGTQTPQSDAQITGCSKDFGIFSGLITTGSKIFNGLRDLIYVVAGFGILGVAVGGFFGNLNWKWLGAIIISLVVIATTGEIINMITGCEGFSQEIITDTLK